MFDLISLTINIGVIGYLIFSIFTKGLPSLGTNYVFISYAVFSILTLPNLLSRVIFKSRLFGITSAFLFLYYPILFLLQVFISYITGLSLNEVLPFGVIFNLILWNSLFILFIIGDNKKGNQSEYALKEIASALTPAILFVLFVFIFIRQKDSIVALDYLQHLTVPNKMFHNGLLCVLPGQCSNLFLQHGYSTFYHIIFGNMAAFLGTDPIKTFYVLDIIFPLVASIPIYMIFKKVTRSTLWSQLGVLLTLLTFVMGGYDFVFFIPQTLALYLFLLALGEKKLKVSQLIFLSLLLMSVHFIIGTLFAGYLCFRFLVVKNLNSKKEKFVFLALLTLSIFFFILANIAGFSVEKLIQEDAVETIGSLTNAYYPRNIYVYMRNLGAGWLLLLITYIGTLLGKRKDELTLSLFSFLAFGTVFYFAAPTYANKFAIGVGFFASLLIIKYIWSLGFKPIIKISFFIGLTLTWGLNFYVQYSRYLTFYAQEDGTVSAIVQEDEAIIEYIQENNLTDTFIISDPYTQLIIASFGNIDTANAQYMRLETRKNLIEYLETPGIKTYEKLLTSPGIPPGTEIYILYTSRLERALELEDYAWLHNIYSLPIDNSYPLNAVNKRLIYDQKRLDNKLIYISDNYILFK